jgi:hypothetical protein
MKHTSFMSEHTAEYILVPDLVRRLTPHFRCVIPMFFWSTREGNKVAARGMENTTVRLLSVFPRRPKISLAQPDQITVKINEELLAYSRAGREIGVPVIAGVPLVSSFKGLRPDSPCCWFDLGPLSSANNDCFIEITSEGRVIEQEPCTTPKSEPISDTDLVALVKQSSAHLWEQTIKNLGHLRRSQPASTGFPFFGHYRPFHFVFVNPERD